MDLAQNTLGGLIESLKGAVLKHGLGEASGFELMGEIGIEFLAGESFQLIVHGNALAQSFVSSQREGAAQQGLADQQQSQVVGRIHVEIEQQRELFEGGMTQQMGFITNEDGVLLFALVQPHEGFRDLAHQIAAIMRRLQVQFAGQLEEKIQNRAGGSVQIENLIEVRVEAGGEGAGGGGLARSHLAGEQTCGLVIDQKLQSSLELSPGLGSE